MKKIRRFTVSVEYKDTEGRSREEVFPVQVGDYSVAKAIAVSYVLQIMRLSDFELRIVGA